MNLQYIRGISIVYYENVVDISKIADDTVLHEYLKNFDFGKNVVLLNLYKTPCNQDLAFVMFNGWIKQAAYLTQRYGKH